MARIFRHSYTKRGEDGRRVTLWAKKWYIEYTDAMSTTRRVPGYKDKRATEQKAADLERHAERERAGILDVTYEHTQAPVIEHINAWLADLKRARRSSEYTRKVDSRVNRMRKELRWVKLGSIQPDSVSRWLALQMKDGLGETTANHYLEAGVAFLNWCMAQRRIERNPLAILAKAEVLEPRCVRRAATLDELRRLLDVAGPRALAYLIAMLTGFRRKELRLLEWRDVFLDDDLPRIELRLATTKSRRADTNPLPLEAAEALREARPPTWKPTDRVFRSIPKSTTVQNDLRRAGIEREIDGKKLDLHALRMTFGTLLATSKVDIREAMGLMRHTDIRLTTQVYTDPRLIDAAGAVRKLPRIRGDEPSEGRQVATGTDGRVVNVDTHQGRSDKSLVPGLVDSLSEQRPPGGEPCHSLTLRHAKDATQRRTGSSVNPFPKATSDSDCHSVSPNDHKADIESKLEAGGIEPPSGIFGPSCFVWSLGDMEGQWASEVTVGSRVTFASGRRCLASSGWRSVSG